ncbi:MAG TPA: hypothetical protein VJJ79_01795 [Candidatus Nanoarchaeia archaeon]|nr:hypothetical protein [Candidatus Nanoarchaeia archaeon]
MENKEDWEEDYLSVYDKEDYLSVYDEDGIFSLLENDAIDIFEAGFMHGYIAG